MPVNVDEIIKKIGLEYDAETGIHIHSKTRIPLTIYYNHDEEELVYLDQTKLPFEVTTWCTKDWKMGADPGIKDLIIRGSQAIGVAGGYCMLLAAVDTARKNNDPQNFVDELKPKAKFIADARPTAQPLPWAVNLAMDAVNKGADGYIVKPVRMDELLRVVKERLRKQQEARTYSEDKVKEFIENRVKELEGKGTH